MYSVHSLDNKIGRGGPQIKKKGSFRQEVGKLRLYLNHDMMYLYYIICSWELNKVTIKLADLIYSSCIEFSSSTEGAKLEKHD